MPNIGKSIRLFLIEGTPSGRWVCELSSWTGKAYKIPRSMVPTSDDRVDLKAPGVYFLFGRNDDDKETIYIGESENVLDRIKQHLSKEAWTECVIFISKDDFLNKAHIKYLENRFHAIATETKRYSVSNTASPTKSSVSEADISELEEYIINARLLVNALGFKAFEPVAESHKKTDTETLSISVAGTNASGQITSEGFVVFGGSSICHNPAPTMTKPLKKLRDKLQEEGKIDQNFLLTEDILFSSPSAASSFVLGYSSSGPVYWKNSQGISLKDIETGKKQV